MIGKNGGTMYPSMKVNLNFLKKRGDGMGGTMASLSSSDAAAFRKPA